MTDRIAHEVTRNADALKNDLNVRHETDPGRAEKHVEALRKGRVLFYGRQEVETGLDNIDWSGSHINHQEWPAQLNRFFWLQHVATQYEETGDESLAELARRTIQDWINQHDYGAESAMADGDNTLNLSIRLGTTCHPGWWGTVPAFADSPHYDDEFLDDMRESTRGQLEYLCPNLTPVGNWRISQLDCLLFCSLVVPGLEEFQPFAVRHLNEAFYRQIHDDGSHEEHNPSYHGWMCRLFTNMWRLGDARPELGLSIDAERVARMWDYAVCSTAPDGGSCGLHDSAPWEPGPGHVTQREKRAEFLREAGLEEDPRMDLEKSPSRWFDCAGQLYLREDWSPESTFIIFDATRWGMSHCHLSRLGVNLYAGGRMLLCDPGIFSYEMSDPYAPHGKSTRAHNTVNIARMNQSEANPDTYCLHVGENVAVAGSRYEGGYWPGTYTWHWDEGKGQGTFGAHDRVLIWLKGRCALVFDVLESDNEPAPCAAHWQLPEGDVTLNAEGRRAWTTEESANLLLQCLDANDSAEMVVHEGEKDPLLGWMPRGKAPGDYAPAPLVAVEDRAGRFWELATLLMPFRGEAPPEFEIEAYERDPQGGPWGYRFGWPDGDETILACTPRLNTQIDRIGPLTTDGAIAIVTLRDGSVKNSFLLDGMRLERNGQVLIDEDQHGVYETSP